MSQPPYQPPVYYATPEPKGLSIASMVTGIASLFFGWTFLVPIVGLVLGVMARKREPAGQGMALAGIIMNGLCIVGWIIAIALLVALGLFGLAAATATR